MTVLFVQTAIIFATMTTFLWHLQLQTRPVHLYIKRFLKIIVLIWLHSPVAFLILSASHSFLCCSVQAIFHYFQVFASLFPALTCKREFLLLSGQQPVSDVGFVDVLLSVVLGFSCSPSCSLSAATPLKAAAHQAHHLLYWAVFLCCSFLFHCWWPPSGVYSVPATERPGTWLLFQTWRPRLSGSLVRHLVKQLLFKVGKSVPHSEDEWTKLL